MLSLWKVELKYGLGSYAGISQTHCPLMKNDHNNLMAKEIFKKRERNSSFPLSEQR